MVTNVDEFLLPRQLHRICQRLQQAGHRCYVVGGAVRDLLMGRAPTDYDLASDAVPEQLMEIFPRVLPTGIQHGTVTILSQGQGFEVTTLRADVGCSDGRHPDQVTFGCSIEEDLARRDFTINAMAIDPLSGKLVDPFDGRGDLTRRLLRAVGDPSVRFFEDGLRIMRLGRFAAQLGFDVDEKTMDGVAGALGRLAGVSVERKRDELIKLLCGEEPAAGLAVFRNGGVFALVNRAVAKQCCPGGSVEAELNFDRLVSRVVSVDNKVYLRLAAFLWDDADAISWLSAWRVDKKNARQVAHLLGVMPEENMDLSDVAVRTLAASIGKKNLDDFLSLLAADGGRRAGLARNLRTAFERLDVRRAPLTVAELAVNGRDLTGGLERVPGRWVGNCLTHLLEYVLANPADNRFEELIEEARRWLEKGKP